jgi:hypothetical protein
MEVQRMSIFDKIKHAIFGSEAQAASLPDSKTSASSAAPSPKIETAQAPVSPAAAPAPAPSATASVIDIVPILDAAAKKGGQKLDWRHSIVDLMKAVGMDASLAERKELAGELGDTGDAQDSAKMNMFLHKALMKKLAENGGKVPADLID